LRVLAIDTALEVCAAAVVETSGPEGPVPVARESVPMVRGHAEALLPIVDRIVGEAGGFRSLDRVAVTVGPGSFTGLRVGISAARAIALATGVPAVGVTTLSAYAAPIIASGVATLVVTAIDARHGQVYLQVFAPAGRTVVAPRIVGAKEAARLLGTGAVRILGSGAPLLAEAARSIGLEVALEDASPAPDIVWVARLGASAQPAQALPKPFYIRAPDAKPQYHVRIPRR
jgi:tRNA threonylcarbamoyl adenosine modification protein YeaZ